MPWHETIDSLHGVLNSLNLSHWSGSKQERQCTYLSRV